MYDVFVELSPQTKEIEMFEKRPTDLKKIGKAIFIGLSLGIPAVAVLPKIIEASQGSSVPIGAKCTYQGDNQWVVESHTDGGYIILDHRTYERRNVSKDEVTIRPSDIPEEYYWFHRIFN